MDPLPNNKHKIDFLISNDTSLIQPTIVKSNSKRKTYKKCNECNRRRKTLDESHQICHVCYNYKTTATYKISGNKVIDDFIRYTQTNYANYIKTGRMEFVPYDQFKDVEFIAEGGFSKIYKATWIDSPVNYNRNYTVVLKKLNNSKNITSKELNELRVFYDVSIKREIRCNNYRKEQGKQNKLNNPETLTRKIINNYDIFSFVSEYLGITQDPITEELMIIMPYYCSGDLIHYLTNHFYDIDWYDKLDNLIDIIVGLLQIHSVNIVHRDLHSGNILIDYYTKIGDLGISKSATESTDDNNQNYGIIPYMAPEIFHGYKYTAESDIYSFGMIMWELMTGRRPFWDRSHDTDLIIEICDGLRPPIVTNAPEGYIELMKECWHSDPNKRPTGIIICEKVIKMLNNEWNNVDVQNPTKIIESPDIGPVTINNPGAFYKSRPLSGMIQSAMSLRSSRNQSIDQSYCWKSNHTASIDKRKPAIEDKNYNNQNVKRRKLLTNKNGEYLTKEIEFDINVNVKSNQTHNNDTEYVTKEIGFDI